MCGIAGIFDSSGDPDRTRHDVAAMIATLVRRGPDDGHVVSSNGWALGARRLAIQDLTLAGRQPMTRGDLTIAYNDPELSVPWPLPVTAMSDSDRMAPPLRFLREELSAIRA